LTIEESCCPVATPSAASLRRGKHLWQLTVCRAQCVGSARVGWGPPVLLIWAAMAVAFTVVNWDFRWDT
jgi:hypothetical protein